MRLSIKNAYVARFNYVSVDGNYMKLFIDENTTEHCYCLIDEEKQRIIDIDNKNIYHILKRNDNGMITSEEAEKITLGTRYALEIQEVKWNQIGLTEKRILYLKALMIDGNQKREEKRSSKLKTLSIKR